MVILRSGSMCRFAGSSERSKFSKNPDALEYVRCTSPCLRAVMVRGKLCAYQYRPGWFLRAQFIEELVVWYLTHADTRAFLGVFVQSACWEVARWLLGEPSIPVCVSNPEILSPALSLRTSFFPKNPKVQSSAGNQTWSDSSEVPHRRVNKIVADMFWQNYEILF